MRTISVIALLLLAGCSNELETGYKPKSLGVTNDERRGYYAPAFSPQSQGTGDPGAPPAKIQRPEGY